MQISREKHLHTRNSKCMCTKAGVDWHVGKKDKKEASVAEVEGEGGSQERGVCWGNRWSRSMCGFCI